MKRTRQLLAIAVAGAFSALAIAQSQETGTTDAVATQTPAAQPEQDAAGGQTITAAGKPDVGYVDLRRITPISGDVAAGQAKSTVCAACHGQQGISIAPTFPNLAGQHADFLYWQLVGFKRTSASPMSPLVTDLDDQDMRDLATYYASLAPAPAEPGAAAAATPADPTLLQRGEQLYLSGDPSRGIPPCQGCHGADARGPAHALRRDRNGHTPYAAWPALRGQQAAYLQAKLADYRDGKLDDSTTDFVMSGVARRLDDDSIQAVSAWLSSLPSQ